MDVAPTLHPLSLQVDAAEEQSRTVVGTLQESYLRLQYDLSKIIAQHHTDLTEVRVALLLQMSGVPALCTRQCLLSCAGSGTGDASPPGAIAGLDCAAPLSRVPDAVDGEHHLAAAMGGRQDAPGGDVQRDGGPGEPF